MVVKKGTQWGRPGRPGPRVPVARSDEEASLLIAQGSVEVILVSGDMAKTVGSSGNEKGPRFFSVPIDLLVVSVRHDDGVTDHRVLSHCVVRRKWSSGGFFRGRFTAFCNAQFLNGRNIAPRGHPNDGKFEIVEIDSRASFRQRFLMLSRMTSGTHVPHPDIHVRQTSAFDEAHLTGSVFIDGRLVVGGLDSIRIDTDAIVVWVPLPFAESNPLDAASLEAHEG